MEKSSERFSAGTAYVHSVYPPVTEMEATFAGLRKHLADPENRARFGEMLAEELQALRQGLPAMEGDQ